MLEKLVDGCPMPHLRLRKCQKPLLRVLDFRPGQEVVRGHPFVLLSVHAEVDAIGATARHGQRGSRAGLEFEEKLSEKYGRRRDGSHAEVIDVVDHADASRSVIQVGEAFGALFVERDGEPTAVHDDARHAKRFDGIFRPPDQFAWRLISGRFSRGNDATRITQLEFLDCLHDS